jgi:hypothetical protein
LKRRVDGRILRPDEPVPGEEGREQVESAARTKEHAADRALSSSTGVVLFEAFTYWQSWRSKDRNLLWLKN